MKKIHKIDRSPRGSFCIFCDFDPGACGWLQSALICINLRFSIATKATPFISSDNAAIAPFPVKQWPLQSTAVSIFANICNSLTRRSGSQSAASRDSSARIGPRAARGPKWHQFPFGRAPSSGNLFADLLLQPPSSTWLFMVLLQWQSGAIQLFMQDQRGKSMATFHYDLQKVPQKRGVWGGSTAGKLSPAVGLSKTLIKW